MKISNSGQVMITDSDAVQETCKSSANESFPLRGNVKVISDQSEAQEQAKIFFETVAESDIPEMIRKLTKRLVKNASSLNEDATNQFVLGFTGLSSLFASRINHAREIQNDPGLIQKENIAKEKEKINVLINKTNIFIEIIKKRNELLKNQIELTKKNKDCFEKSIYYTAEAIKNFERSIVSVSLEEKHQPVEESITSDRVISTVESTLKHVGRMTGSMSNMRLLTPKADVADVFKKQLKAAQKMNELNTNELSALERKLTILLNIVGVAKKQSLAIDKQAQDFFRNPLNALLEESSSAVETTPMHHSSNLISATDALKVKIEHFNDVKSSLLDEEKFEKEAKLHAEIEGLKVELQGVIEKQTDFQTNGDGSKLKTHEVEFQENQRRIQDIQDKSKELNALTNPEAQASFLSRITFGLLGSSSSSKELEIKEEVKLEETQELEENTTADLELQETTA